MEVIRLALNQDGGIILVMSAHVEMQIKVLTVALKKEVLVSKGGSTSNKRATRQSGLAMTISVNFVSKKRKKAQYSCGQIITELLQCLSQFIEHKSISGAAIAPDAPVIVTSTPAIAPGAPAIAPCTSAIASCPSHCYWYSSHCSWHSYHCS